LAITKNLPENWGVDNSLTSFNIEWIIEAL